MKLDVNVLRYLSKEEFRVLTSVEMGQKNVGRRSRRCRRFRRLPPLCRFPRLAAVFLLLCGSSPTCHHPL